MDIYLWNGVPEYRGGAVDCGGRYAHDSIATERERKTLEVKTEEREITFFFGLLYLYLYTYIKLIYFFSIILFLKIQLILMFLGHLLTLTFIYKDQNESTFQQSLEFQLYLKLFDDVILIIFFVFFENIYK